MDAVLFPLAIFLSWCAIGYGPLVVLAGDRPPLARVLLAPAFGLALLTTFTFWINRLGYPVQQFATLEVAALAAASIACVVATYLVRRQSPQIRDAVAFAWLIPLLCGAMVLVGWPGISHGLNWLGYANDDMANYVLSASRLRTHGYYDPPSFQSILDGSDMSQLYWALNLTSRYGGDLVLAAIASVIHRGEAPLFMPTMLALHSSLIAAVTALLVAERPFARVACAVIFAIAINPLVHFSTYSELFAQAGGLVLASAVTALLVDVWRKDVQATIRTTFATIIPFLALFIWYSEIIVPFLGAIAIYFAINARLCIAAWKRLVPAALTVVLATALLSGDYLWVALRYTFVQITEGIRILPSDTLTFPYFLVRAGISSFWGLTPIIDLNLAQVPQWKLYAGIIMFTVAGVALINSLRQRSLSASLVGVLSSIALLVWWRQADFVVFKAVLYLQPFLSALLAAQLIELVSRYNSYRASSLISLPDNRHYTHAGQWLLVPAVIVACPIVVLLADTQLRTAAFYGNIAADQSGPGYFNELPGASEGRLLQYLEHLERPGPNGRYILDTYNPVLTKLTIAYTSPTPARMVSQNPFKVDDLALFLVKRYPSLATIATSLRSIEIPFTWGTSGKSDLLRIQAQERDLPTANDVLIAATADNSILNRVEFNYPNDASIQIRSVAKVSNHLVFMPTKLSRPFFDYDYNVPSEEYREYRQHVALWPNEHDYYYPGRTMAGAGRYVFLGVINFTGTPRLVLEISSSFKRDGANVLPPVQVMGQSVIPLDIKGRGSARIFSPPITAMRLDKWDVLGIDMGVEGRQSVEKDGHVVIDPRWLTSYLRDVSLVSEGNYLQMKLPSIVDRFPQGLYDKNLEYSGIYEDGWMGEVAYLRLAAPTVPTQFWVAGMMPWDPKTSGVSQLVITVDGVEKARKALSQGEFSISFPLDPSNNPVHIQISADGTAPLSAQDNRPASVRLSMVGWRPDDAASLTEFRPGSDSESSADAVGFWTDGWAATHAEVTLTGGTEGQLSLQGMVPDLGHSFVTTLTASGHGRKVGTVDIKPGNIEVEFPVPAAINRRRIVLEFKEGQNLPAPDTRRVGILIRQISIR